MKTATLAVMLSGSGRTLANLCDRIAAGTLNGRVGLVIVSKECPGAEKARQRGLAVRVMPGVIEREALGAALREVGAEWVVLAGYLKVVRIPAGFEGKVVNIHPALLPSFGGMGMYGQRVHEAVLATGCKVSGCTVHLCDERYDTGPILVQRSCEVREDDTAGTLAARVFELEREAYPAALGLLLAGRVRLEGGGKGGGRARILPDAART